MKKNIKQTLFNYQNRSKAGFTMVELLVVATIIIILASIGLVSYRVAVERSRLAKCNSDLEAVRQAMVMYRSEEGRYDTLPGNFADLVNALKAEGYLAQGDVFTHPLRTGVYELSNLSSTTFTLNADNCGGETVTVTQP